MSPRVEVVPFPSSEILARSGLAPDHAFKSSVMFSQEPVIEPPPPLLFFFLPRRPPERYGFRRTAPLTAFLACIRMLGFEIGPRFWGDGAVWVERTCRHAKRASCSVPPNPVFRGTPSDPMYDSEKRLDLAPSFL